MFPDLIPIESSAHPAPPARYAATLALFSPSEHAERRFWEFFTAHIRNRNTHLAYLGSTKKCGVQVDALMGVSVSGPRSRQDRWPSEAAPAAWPHTFWNSPKPVT